MNLQTQIKRAAPAVGMAAIISLTTFAQASAQGVTLPPVSPASVTGNINTGGSSTVGPLSAELTSRFKQDGYTGEIKLDVIGSGAGIQRFCRNEYDIGNASRAMTAAEIATCKAAGLDAQQFKVGIDALTVVVNPQNTWARNLNRQQLALIFSGAAKTWKDVNSAWPNEPIKIFSPGTDSGTYDYFVEQIFSNIPAAQRRNIIPQVPGVQLSENDNVLVQGVEGDKNAIGYFGYAYYEEEKNRLRAVNYEGVAPNAGTVATGRYKFARPLFIVSAPSIIKSKPQVASFINYYLSNVDKVIRGVGYFPVPAAELVKTKQQFLDASK